MPPLASDRRHGSGPWYRVSPQLALFHPKKISNLQFYKTWVNHDSLNSIALVPPSLSHPSRAMVDWHSPTEIARDAREVISPSTLIPAIHLIRHRGLYQSHPHSLWSLHVSTSLRPRPSRLHAYPPHQLGTLRVIRF